MKYSITIILTLILKVSIAQISFLKELNSVEESSSPENFTEINSITFFSIKTLDGYNIWKTDGTEAGTVVVSTQAIDIENIDKFDYGIPNFHVLNNELYYYVQKPKSVDYYQPLQLWKTDGTNLTLVLNDITRTPLYYFNNHIYYLNFYGLFKIENGTSLKIKNFPYPSLYYSGERPVLLNNQLIFSLIENIEPNHQEKLQIWKSDGTELGTTPIKTIDKLYAFHNDNLIHKKVSITIGSQVFFILKRINTINFPYRITVEVWKTDGVDTSLIKELYSYDAEPYGEPYDKIPTKMANFDGKLIFLFSTTDLWISNGTSAGTNMIKKLKFLTFESTHGKWGFLNNKFLFTASILTEDDYELWQSDGTEMGTEQLKNINTTTNPFPNNSSAPNYFTTINNKLYFKTLKDEIWQTDGTVNGTVFIQNISHPSNSSTNSPAFIYTSNSYLLYSYYDIQNGYELWKTNGITQNILKNITTYNKPSLGSDKKVRVGNVWYFNGADYHGAELWKSDGTSEGTVLVKDLNSGIFSAIIQEIVAVGSTVYFTAIFSNEDNTRLFKTDGTENGTVEINVYDSNVYLYPNYLTPSINKLYFKGYNIGIQTPWISLGSASSTKPLLVNYEYSQAFSNLVSVEDKLFFTSSGLWISDGTQENTYKVFGNETVNVPLNPIRLIEFKNKVYFFSQYRDINFVMKYALFESNGTKIGTKIVKEFGQDLISTYLLFLEKTSDKLYFRPTLSYQQNFDLWTSDGTTEGTTFLKTLNAQGNVNLKFSSIGNQFYMFINQQYVAIDNILWTSNGTIDGTKQILQKQNSSIVSSIASFKCKLYFSLFDTNYGQELWESDGTNTGTHLTEEIIEGIKSSNINNLMSFENKLVFWGKNTTSGIKMWQYLPPSTLSIKNQSIQSGSWNFSNTWSCGSIPTQDNIITIKTGHFVTIPENYRTSIKGITTESGAFLTIPKSAVFTVRPH